MGFYCGGEYIQSSDELQPPDDAGVRYDAECAGEEAGEFCDNCGCYIGEEAYERNGGLCRECREPY